MCWFESNLASKASSFNGAPKLASGEIGRRAGAERHAGSQIFSLLTYYCENGAKAAYQSHKLVPMWRKGFDSPFRIKDNAQD